MEEIYSFIIDSVTAGSPFYIELAGITFPDPGYEIRRECSDVYVLEYIMDGSGTVEIDGRIFHPQKGDVYLLTKGSRHHYYASKDDPFKKIWMNINGDLCEHLIQAYRLSGKYYFENVPVYDLFDRFLTLCRRKETAPADLFQQCSVVFLEILQKLSRHVEKKHPMNPYVLRAKTFCDRNIYETITAAQTAQYVSLSVSQLNRLFKKELGVTIYAYILNNKINTAKTLLSGTALSVSEIAFLLKFTDEHYFSNIFKKKTGRTPTEFRQL